MAVDAGSAGDAVVVIDVTVAALPRRHGVRSGQGEAGLRVIERRRLPCRSVMARVTGLRESARDVVRVRGVLKILEMTRDAGRAGQAIIVVGVAVGTLPRRNRVRSSQSKVHH